MMDEKDIKLQARIMAIEQLLTRQIAHSYLSNGYSLDVVRSMHKLQLKRADRKTLPPNTNGRSSERITGEYVAELDRLLGAVENHFAAARVK